MSRATTPIPAPECRMPHRELVTGRRGDPIVMEPPAEEFLDACGAGTPPLLVVERSGGGEMARRTLHLPFALIGRDERADLHLDDEEVSPHHAYLQLMAGRLWCVDLGSRTGIHWQEGRRAVGPLLVRQSLGIGPYTIRLAEGGSHDEDDGVAPANPLSSEADDPSSLPRVSLEFHGATTQQRLWSMDRPLALIGRSSICKVRLHSPTVSRIHAALLNTPVGPWIVDLLSRTGTHVKGAAVRWTRVENGDELQIGQFRISVRFRSPAPRALPALLSFPSEQSSTESYVFPPPPTAAGTAALGELLSKDGGAFFPPALPRALSSAMVPASGTESLLLPLLTQFSQMQQQMFDQFQQNVMLMVQMFGGLQREQIGLIRQELEQLRQITRELQEVQGEYGKQAPALPPAPTAPPDVAATVSSPPVAAALPPVTHGAEKALPPPPVAAPTASSAGPSKGDVHAWLAQRLATLQQEQQSRWQRILSVLTGK